MDSQQQGAVSGGRASWLGASRGKVLPPKMVGRSSPSEPHLSPRPTGQEKRDPENGEDSRVVEGDHPKRHGGRGAGSFGLGLAG